MSESGAKQTVRTPDLYIHLSSLSCEDRLQGAIQVSSTSPVPLLPLVPGDVVMTTLPGPCYLLPPSRLLCSV